MWSAFPACAAVPPWLEAPTTAEDFATLFPHLTLAQIHDAMSYWYDLQDEIAADLDAQDAVAAAFQDRDP